MKRLIVLALLLSGCSVTAQMPDIEQKVNQHSAILAAITNYIADLQDKGMLPKPESKE